MQETKNRIVLTLLLLIACFITSYSQTVVRGIIKDAATKQPLQSVSIYFKGGKGVTSGADGAFTLTSVNPKLTTVQFSYVGYKTITKNIFPGREQEINVQLEVADSKNNVYVTTNKRSKYRNKNNPAVELIRKVIEQKDKNRISAYDYVSYSQYEKMELLLTKTPEKLLNNKLLKNWKFVFENNDSTKIEGRAMLPVYMDETFSQKYYRKNPEKNKTYILGDKKVSFG